MVRRAFGAILLGMLVAGPGPCSPPPPPAPPAPWLHTQGRWFRDAQGRTVVLRGFNYSHRSKYAPFTEWMSPDHFDTMKSWGANAVRLLVLWELVEPAPGAYDDAYLDHVEEVVAWCAERKLHVVLDMHQDLYGSAYGGDGAPAWATAPAPGETYTPVSPWFLNYLQPPVMDAFSNFWASPDLRAHYRGALKQLVVRFKDQPHVLGYEIMNEPHPGWSLPPAFEAGALRGFYLETLAELSPLTPYQFFLFEPAVSAGSGLPSFVGTLPYPRTAFAPHYYHPLATPPGASYDGTAWPIHLALGIFEGDAHNQYRAPWVLGEYGIPLGNAGALDYLADIAHEIELRRVPGAFYWDFNPFPGEEGVAEIDTFMPGDPELAILVRPYPRAAAGTIQAWSFDPATKHFELSLRARAGITNAVPTEVFLPVAWQYPGGFVVKLDGQSAGSAAMFDANEQVLSLALPWSHGTHAITVDAIP